MSIHLSWPPYKAAGLAGMGVMRLMSELALIDMSGCTSRAIDNHRDCRVTWRKTMDKVNVGIAIKRHDILLDKGRHPLR